MVLEELKMLSISKFKPRKRRPLPLNSIENEENAGKIESEGIFFTLFFFERGGGGREGCTYGGDYYVLNDTSVSSLPFLLSLFFLC